MKYSIMFFVAVIAFGLVGDLRVAAGEKHAAELDMKKKLEYSKNILDGLVTEDFDKILSNAKSLNRLGERKWIENESSEYRTQNQVFWFTTGALVLAAEEKNIDGVTLSYTQMTHSCVNCHRVLRAEQRKN